ncbi:MAG: aconitase family protein, partial [Pseudomonadota bacterium]|nr:aconitase family protein [Pseudomonadota bacterium]
QTTFDYLAGRPFAPQGANWDAAVAAWSDLVSDADAVFDHEEHIDAGDVAPQITWGTSPEHTVAVTEAIPTPGDLADPIKQSLAEAALDYQGLTAGAPIAGTPVDWVFIGSCTNGRLSDLQSAAAIARGRRVAAGVTARIVPGSMAVKAAAEAEGLDRVFTEAGFEWREPGCAQCVSTNGEFVPEGARCVSTSNRNFVGRQGPGARTHLASPAMAAAAAIAGQITDSRSL